MSLSRAALAGAALAAAACGSAADARRSDSVQLAARAARLEAKLAAPPDSGSGLGAPVARWVLPEDLGEVSGLALTADGRLLAHNDERAVISIIDPKRGALLGRFVVGSRQLHADFEGITVADGRIFMVTSNGTLYEFRERQDAAPVPYSLHDTRLGKECEFEGVAFDRAADALVLSCKRVGTKSLKDQLVLYRWNLQGEGGTRLTTLTVPLDRIVAGHPWKELHPSDITVDPSTGNYVLVAAQEQALVELTPSGEVVRTLSLPKGHQQSEGIAITPDGLLILSDEAKTGPASITLYRWKTPPANTMGSP